MSEANAVATRLPEFSQHEPLTWFRRTETRFRLRGIKQATTKADYVLEALPETIFRRIGPWLDQQPDEIPYDDLNKHLLREFSPITSERARGLLLMPSQPIGDRKPSQLWDEISMLSRLPETDGDSKNKEVDLKKEIWLQTLPSCVRVLLHNTDEKSTDDLSTLADEIMMSQNAACHDTSRCLPPMSCTSEELPMSCLSEEHLMSCLSEEHPMSCQSEELPMPCLPQDLPKPTQTMSPLSNEPTGMQIITNSMQH